jgi:hypothetical protein
MDTITLAKSLVSYAGVACRWKTFGFEILMMEHPTFVALMDDEAVSDSSIFITSLCLRRRTKASRSGLADGSRVSVTGRGAVELFKFIAERSIAPDGHAARRPVERERFR